MPAAIGIPYGYLKSSGASAALPVVSKLVSQPLIKKQTANKLLMGTLKEDIKTQSDWIVKAFAADNFKLDYTIDSFIEIDRFFNANMQNGKPKKGGRLAKKGFGPVLFSMGAYLGETIIKNVKGSEWITDDNDPEAELHVSMKLPDGTIIWPIQRVMKRFQNGNEDSIYPYGHSVTSAFTGQPFNKLFWDLAPESNEPAPSKPWWKFW